MPGDATQPRFPALVCGLDEHGPDARHAVVGLVPALLDDVVKVRAELPRDALAIGRRLPVALVEEVDILRPFRLALVAQGEEGVRPVRELLQLPLLAPQIALVVIGKLRGLDRLPQVRPLLPVGQFDPVAGGAAAEFEGGVEAGDGRPRG